MADSAQPSDAGPPRTVPVTVPPGADDRATQVWQCKERIRRREGLLDQRRPFFDAQYRQSTCYLSVTVDEDGPAIPGGEPGSGARREPDGVARGGPGARPRDAPTPVGDVAGFAVVRPDGYLSLLGVAPAHRRRGLGSGLLARAVDDRPALSCHVRATNTDALGFYADRGFLVEGRVAGYYRDGTDAYHLVRDPERAEGVAAVLE